MLRPYNHSAKIAEVAQAALQHAIRAGDTRMIGQARAELGAVAANEGRIDEALEGTLVALRDRSLPS